MAEVANRTDLVNNYLVGLNLTDDYGNPYPDSLYNQAINYGVTNVARILDLDLEPVEFYAGDINAPDFATRVNLPQTKKDPQGRYGAERVDLVAQEPFWRFRLRRRPVLDPPSRIIIIYPGASEPVLVIPQTWIQVADMLAGHVEIHPAVNSVPASYLGVGLVRAPSHFALMPGMMRVDYRAGFEQVPADILQAIYLIAAMNVLNPAGDLIVGAGIASSSLSFAGLSQSVNTTSSATNAGYGSRIIQYNKELESLLPRLRAYYHGAALMMV